MREVLARNRKLKGLGLKWEFVEAIQPHRSGRLQPYRPGNASHAQSFASESPSATSELACSSAADARPPNANDRGEIASVVVPRRLYPGGVNWPTAPTPPRRNKAMGVAIGAALLAMVIAIAALIVGIIDLTRPATSASPLTGTSSMSTPARQLSPVDMGAANRALCVVRSQL